LRIALSESALSLFAGGDIRNASNPSNHGAVGERVEYESEIPFCGGAESAFYRVVYVPDRDAAASTCSM
jgi:hypothetical protein